MTIKKAKTISADNNHARCLFCGNLNPKSLKLSFHAGVNGIVETRFKAEPELQGYDDFLHGGVLSGLLDAAMTHCLFHQGIQAVTGDLHVRFVRPVACGTFMDICAWVQLSSPPLYRLKAEIKVEDQLMARAEGKFVRWGGLNEGREQEDPDAG